MVDQNTNDAMEALFDPERLEENVELWENLQRAWANFVELAQSGSEGAHAEQSASLWSVDPLEVHKSLTQNWLNFWSDPAKLAERQAELWGGIASIWTHFFINPEEPCPVTPGKDRRFSHEGWQQNMSAAFLRYCYQYYQNWVSDIVAEIDGLDEQERTVLELSTRNAVEAINPANFPMLNPEVIDTTIREKGENLVRGAKMMREDFERGGGKLIIRQVDYDAFEIGRNVAITKGEVIFEGPHFQIIQYSPTTEVVKKTPLLIIPPWINKYYILDLNEKKSFASYAVSAGYSVFMISWINADASTRDFTWESRMKALRGAIDVVREECEAEKVHLVSFCIGGTMTGTMLAEMGRRRDDAVASTTFLTAQFDFEHAGELKAFVSEAALGSLDQYEEAGFIPAEAMSTTFNLLRSNDLIWSYVTNNYFLGKKPMAFDLLYWNSDSMRMPIQVQKFYLQEFYLNNAFMKGELPMGDHRIGVDDITVPTYHLAAIDDHIAPALSVYVAARAMKNAKVRYVLSGSGHIAGVVNPPVLEKYQYWYSDDLSAPDLDSWRAGARSNPGSWWLDWTGWLGGFDDEEVEARAPGTHHKPIEKAPGRYVKVRYDKAG